jgi:hypothetical protein
MLAGNRAGKQVNRYDWLGHAVHPSLKGPSGTRLADAIADGRACRARDNDAATPSLGNKSALSSLTWPSPEVQRHFTRLPLTQQSQQAMIIVGSTYTWIWSLILLSIILSPARTSECWASGAESKSFMRRWF